MKKWFSAFARAIATLAGHPLAFVLAVLSVVVWAALGPRAKYSSDWQLWINTSTTILTFLMVFLLQHTQNHDTRAIQLKLDELIRAIHGARNELINLEDLPDDELAHYCSEFRKLHERYATQMAERVQERKRRNNKRLTEQAAAAGRPLRQDLQPRRDSLSVPPCPPPSLPPRPS
jgi:low affinity Fe/Cu permease